MTGSALAAAIDALLPQTQCTQCGYDGCLPYARAVATGEADINRCPPGGKAGVHQIARLLGREAKPLNPANGVERPRAVALIDEARCIGCTLCIQACPVDAIVGAPKYMHTVIAAQCTGCELCVPPCPVDCIAMLPVPQAHSAWTRAMAEAARERYSLRNARLARARAERAEILARKAQEKPAQTMPDAKQAIILAAVERARARTAGTAPRNTLDLPPQAPAQIAATDARRAAAKKR